MRLDDTYQQTTIENNAKKLQIDIGLGLKGPDLGLKNPDLGLNNIIFPKNAFLNLQSRSRRCKFRTLCRMLYWIHSWYDLRQHWNLPVKLEL